MFCKLCDHKWVYYIDYTKIIPGTKNFEFVENLLIKLNILNKEIKDGSLICRIYKSSTSSYNSSNQYIFQSFIKDYPKSLTQELCDEFFECNQESIKYIPKEYQSKSMINLIISNLSYGNLWYLLNINEEVRERFNQCDYIEFIPPEFQTKKVTLSLGRNIKNFKYVREDLLTKEMIERAINAGIGFEIPEKFYTREIVNYLLKKIFI